MESDFSVLCLIYLLLLISGLFFFIRGCQLAIGKNISKFYKTENFLLNQEISAIMFVLMGFTSFWLNPMLAFLGISAFNLCLLCAFYLQPTPRISRIVLLIASAGNIVSIVYLLVIAYF